MPKSNNDIVLSIVVLAAISCLLIYNFINPFFSSSSAPNAQKTKITKLILTDAEWKAHLSPLQYDVMREGATEPAFSGKYNNFKEKGTYICAACSLPLFSSQDKLDLNTGWPCFSKPINENNVWQKKSAWTWLFWSSNEEVFCSRCDSHLGHIASGGPPPKNEHYCVNSIALNFVPEKVETPSQTLQGAPSPPTLQPLTK